MSNDQLDNGAVSASAIDQIMALLPLVAEQLEPEYAKTQQWMASHCSDPVIAEILEEGSFLTLRVVDAIGRLEPVNGITISKQFGIPKGSVSKVTRRLLAQQLISQESLPHNRKEILFRLTPLGRELFEVHRAFDQQMERGFIRFLQRYSSNELHMITRVLQDMLNVSFLELGSERAAADTSDS